MTATAQSTSPAFKSGVHMYIDMMNDFQVKSYYSTDWDVVKDPDAALTDKIMEIAKFVIRGTALAFASIAGLTIFPLIGTLRNVVLIVSDVTTSLRGIQRETPTANTLNTVQTCVMSVLSKVALISLDITAFFWCRPLSVAYGFFPSQTEACVNKLEGYTNYTARI